MNKKNRKRIASLVLLSSLLMSSYALSDSKSEDNTLLDDNNIEITLNNNSRIPKYMVNKYGYMLYDTIIYNDTEKLEGIAIIDKYQQVYVIGNDENGYSKIAYNMQTNAQVTGYIPTSSLQLIDDKFVEVDLSEQKVRMYENNLRTVDSLTVTGKPSTPTREGYFDIYYKERNATLRGSNSDGSMYASFVDYWMPFDGGIGLHDAEYHTDNGYSHGWRSHDNFGGETYKTNGSHGCVNLYNETAKYIYDNSEVGTKVLVHK